MLLSCQIFCSTWHSFHFFSFFLFDFFFSLFLLQLKIVLTRCVCSRCFPIFIDFHYNPIKQKQNNAFAFNKSFIKFSWSTRSIRSFPCKFKSIGLFLSVFETNTFASPWEKNSFMIVLSRFFSLWLKATILHNKTRNSRYLLCFFLGQRWKRDKRFWIPMIESRLILKQKR